AGRQGSSRDAIVVGATVTATHTGGVLLLGLALTVSSSLAGESVLGWLGVISGLIITSLGGALLVGAMRPRVPGRHDREHGFGHSHRFGHSHHGHHGQPHGDAAPRRTVRGRTIRVRVHAPDDVRLAQPAGAVMTLTATRRSTATVVGRTHRSVTAATAAEPVTPVAPVTPVSRRGLVGMGIAGGLVPSPSALIVLLSAIALGRTIFGIVLVIGYGLGMAATLTLAGLLLVRVRDRLQRRDHTGTGRLARVGRRWSSIAPYATATLVVVVGIGIAIRGVSSIGG
ncbi:MAG: putative nickel transporter, partial [Ilumatobacteraceae bacterium]|nr:putative nickel transporter [Ilumatobacteraceae bacterium]